MADEAARRREARRRRILDNAQSRLDRVLGKSDSREGSQGSDSGSSNSSVTSKIQDALGEDDASSKASRNRSDEGHPADVSSSCKPDVEAEEEPEVPRMYSHPEPVTARRGISEPVSSGVAQTAAARQRVRQQDSPAHDPTMTTESVKSEREESPFTDKRLEEKLKEHRAFTLVRQLACALVGILVRLALGYQIGATLIGSMMYPFIAMEITVIGYQKTMEMDMGIEVKGGLWLSTLVLSGIKPEVIQAYKTVAGAAASIMDDFTVYFFTFVVTHLVSPAVS